MRLAMIGCGYVGLVSGTCFADFGHNVICVDTDEKKIGALNGGKLPIFEPGLDTLVRDNVAAGRLAFTTDIAEALRDADAVFIAVGTPSRRGDGHADLSYVYGAAEQIAKSLNGYTVVITKSTVPVGTGDEVERIIRRIAPDADVSVVSNPEFLREGAAISDFKIPDRVVVGVEDDRAADTMKLIYKPVLANGPLVEMSRRSAELTKYAANAFLATKITFINEVADLCEGIGANVEDVSRGIGLDKRIGPQFLRAGPGYGGSCFPKDTLAFLKTSQDYAAPQRIVESVVAVNEMRKRAMGRKIIHAIGGDVRDKTVALLGLTFKANTDDMRDSPAIDIVMALQDAGMTVKAFDPQGMEQAADVISNVEFCNDPYEAITGSNAVVIVTDWDEFNGLDLARVADLLIEGNFVDLRNTFSASAVEAAGMKYVGVGQ